METYEMNHMEEMNEDVNDSIPSIIREMAADVCEFEVQEDGIGGYEFWGAHGVDSSKGIVLSNAELIRIDITNTKQKEDDEYIKSVKFTHEHTDRGENSHEIELVATLSKIENIDGKKFLIYDIDTE